jgi:hypothetical protein
VLLGQSGGRFSSFISRPLQVFFTWFVMLSEGQQPLVKNENGPQWARREGLKARYWDVQEFHNRNISKVPSSKFCVV